jgi:DNA-binding MarR family transcriptional regulator
VLGAALRRAWVGYQQRLDAEMAAAGFGDRGFPDGRVLRMCAGPSGTSISDVSRRLGITRQGAAKIVNGLRDRGYVAVSPSPTSGREKLVTLTPRALDYLAAHRKAARTVERRVRKELGDEVFDGLYALLDALGADDDLRMRDYLRSMRRDEL